MAPPFRAPGSESPPPFVAIRGPCDLRCAWCNHRGERPLLTAGERERVRSALSRLAAQGVRQIGLGAHVTEPTRHPDFPDLLDHAASVGFERIHLATSGIRLAEPGVAASLVQRGLTDVTLTFAGLDARLSDRLLGRAGGAAAKEAALRACLAEGLTVTAMLMLLRPLLHGAPAMMQRLRALTGAAGAGLTVLACYPTPTSTIDARRFAALWPRYDELLWTMGRIHAVDPGARLVSTALPSCVSRRLPESSLGADAFAPGQVEMIHPVELCEACQTRGPCPGVPSVYLEAHGRGPLLRRAEGVEPPPPEQISLDGLCRTEPRVLAPWERRFVAFLRRLEAPALFGFTVVTVTSTDHGLTVALGREEQQLVAYLERRDDRRPYYRCGARLGVRYQADGALPGPERGRLLDRLLQWAERADSAARGAAGPSS